MEKYDSGRTQGMVQEKKVCSVDGALIEYLGKPVPVAGEALLSFMVADLEASIAAVVAHGGRDLSGVIEAPDWQMRLAFVADPGGHRIELMQGTGDRDRD